MGRPRGVNYKTFHEYDKLHTVATKMMCGVHGVTLYPIKETEQFYISPEVWSHCASKFKMKKKNLPQLNVTIPTITDKATIDFLEEHSWKDWVNREQNAENPDMIETIQLLKNIYPDKEAVFFYELNNLVNLYYQGTLVSYDDNGNLEPMSERDIEHTQWYNNRYNHMKPECPKIDKAYEAYRAIDGKENKDAKTAAYKVYAKLLGAYHWEHNNNVETFKEIGKNCVCYPVAYSRGTADWYKEKYGTVCSYAHAGEIFFVVTSDKIFFEYKRHY